MISFDKLFLLLKKKSINKKDFARMADISTHTVTQLYKNKSVTTNTLEKICKVLKCQISDIMEYVIK